MDPVVQQALARGFTPFETILIYGIIAALVGVGGLFTYVVKAVLPRMISSFDKAADGVALIPSAIKSFELALTTTEAKIGDRISALGAKLEGKIDDQRIEKMREELRRFDGAVPPSAQGCKPGA